MALTEYEIDLPGGRKATVLLNEDDAASYGDAARPVAAPAPAAPAAPVDTKARAPRNKARSTENKD